MRLVYYCNNSEHYTVYTIYLLLFLYTACNATTRFVCSGFQYVLTILHSKRMDRFFLYMRCWACIFRIWVVPCCILSINICCAMYILNNLNNFRWLHDTCICFIDTNCRWFAWSSSSIRSKSKQISHYGKSNTSLRTGLCRFVALQSFEIFCHNIIIVIIIIITLNM